MIINSFVDKIRAKEIVFHEKLKVAKLRIDFIEVFSSIVFMSKLFVEFASFKNTFLVDK